MSLTGNPMSEVLIQQEGQQIQHNESLNSSVKAEPIDSQPPMYTSEFDLLFDQVQKKPGKYDADLWKKLITTAEAGDTAQVRKAYDALLAHYPHTSSAQIRYINHFLDNPETFNDAEGLFRKFLKKSPSVDLCKFYLTYVRRVNSSPSTRKAVQDSYDFAVSLVGQDKDSGEIWYDYIQFINASQANSTWETQQKMDKLRSIYKLAVQIPLENVTKLWEDYEAFETGLNKITAKKFITDLNPSYVQARQVLRELKAYLKDLYPPYVLNPSNPPEIFLPSLPTFNASDRALVGKWKTYLKWEEGNPLLIEEKDKAQLISRIQSVYRKAVIRMRFFPEIWFMAYTWTNTHGKLEDSTALLKAGLEANPSSFLLTFAYAELLESQSKLEEVKETYDKLLPILQSELEELETTEGEPNGDQAESQNSQASQASSSVLDPKRAKLKERRKQFSVVWIMYMRFLRRAEGVQAARKIFSRSRKTSWITWEVFEAAALMEFHCSEDKGIPSRIFEKGLELYADEIDYVIRYLVYLISVNDESNARALFERVIGTFPSDKARPLWERWARYEYQFGDLQAALQLENRIAAAYPTDPPIKRFAQRHMYSDLDVIANRDLGFPIAIRAATAGKSETPSGSQEKESKLQGRPEKRPALSPPPQSDSRRSRDDRDHPRVEYDPPGKRQRQISRERDRDRRRSPAAPASWSRDPKRRGLDRDRDDEKIALPPVIKDFTSRLPPGRAFDGPVFRTDDLMNLFRNAVIPSTRPRSPNMPPPLPRGSRPPPDYGPYQGPGGGNRRRY